MNKKNSIVLKHKNCFEKFEYINKIYNNFKKKIISEKNKYFLVGVSGGPDSMALAAMCKAFECDRRCQNGYVPECIAYMCGAHCRHLACDRHRHPSARQPPESRNRKRDFRSLGI